LFWLKTGNRASN